jgi:hypothetical protein
MTSRRGAAHLARDIRPRFLGRQEDAQVICAVLKLSAKDDRCNRTPWADGKVSLCDRERPVQHLVERHGCTVIVAIPIDRADVRKAALALWDTMDPVQYEFDRDALRDAFLCIYDVRRADVNQQTRLASISTSTRIGSMGLDSCGVQAWPGCSGERPARAHGGDREVPVLPMV